MSTYLDSDIQSGHPQKKCARRSPAWKAVTAALAALASTAALAMVQFGVSTPTIAHAAGVATSSHSASSVALDTYRLWDQGGGTTMSLSIPTGFSAIAATWVEPSFPTGGTVLVWAGIQNNGNCSVGCLVQAGDGLVTGPSPEYVPSSFWIENYPDQWTIFPQTHPLPGDLVSSSLSLLASGQWQVTLADQSQHMSQTWTEAWSVSGGPQDQHAEFAVESMPGYPALCTPVDWLVATVTTGSGQVIDALPSIAATQAATPTPATGCPTPAVPATVGMAPTPDGKGYWLVAADGGVFSHGDAQFYGSTGAIHLNQPIVGMAATPDGKGYWLVAADGGIFAFGDAAFHGSTGAMTLNRPIVGMALTLDGKGYWLVAADGGVFSHGDAQFYGSTGAMALNRPIVGVAPASSGNGYWLAASDGGIFAFGDAAFHGSTGATTLNRPIVGMAATPDGKGYWLVATDGGIFTFGDAGFDGSMGGTHLNKPITGMAASPDGKGYWLVATGGGIFSLGVPSYGTTG